MQHMQCELLLAPLLSFQISLSITSHKSSSQTHQVLKTAKEAESTRGRVLLAVSPRPSCPGGRVRCLCWTIRDSRASGAVRQTEQLRCAQAFCCSCSFVAAAWLGARKGQGLIGT